MTAFRRPGRRLVLALFTALALQGAHAATAEPAFLDAYRFFEAALAGDSTATERAAERFSALSAAEPADPVLRAYVGAATTAKARDTLLPWRKMRWAEDGLAQLDMALAMLKAEHDQPLHRGTPASLETRFVAASTFLSVPEFLHRGPRGEQLLAQVLQHPLFAQSPLEFQGVVWMRAGRHAQASKKPEEARRWFETVVQRHAPQAAAARAALQALVSP